MAHAIKRYVILNWSGENHKYWRVTTSDKSALIKSIRQLERDLGKVPGSLRKYFLQDERQNWEVHIC